MKTLRRSTPLIQAVLLSGTLWFLSAGIYHAWLLAWFAPLPLLLIVLDLRVRNAALASVAASTLGALSFVAAYTNFPPILRASMILLFALPFTTTALLWREIVQYASPLASVAAFPALVVSLEYLISLISPNGTFGSLSYSQGDVPVILQLASVTGAWGISFLLSLVPAALCIAWRHRRKRRVAATVMAAALGPLGLTLVFGEIRLSQPQPSRLIPIGLAVSDADQEKSFSTENAAGGLSVVRAYAHRAAVLAHQGARMVVLPEKCVGLTPETVEAARTLLREAAKNNTVDIVAGLNLLGLPQRRNTAVVFGARGNVALEYDKQHLVPGFEAKYHRGNTPGLIAGTNPVIGVAICKDLDFVPLGREYARAETGLLLVPAWDFVNDGWLHSRMAVMRGVEGGYAVARSASGGRLTVSDANGRVQAERTSDASAEVLLEADVPVGPGGTFYSRTGDWFAWLCLGIAAVCLYSVGKSRRRAKL